MEARRSGNYEASVWDDDYIQSLDSPYTGKECVKQAEKLKSHVKVIIDETENQLDRLEFIDDLQRLHISNHFEDRVEAILKNIYQTIECHEQYTNKDLHVTALKFRLLRQHGYHVPQEVFCGFTDEFGNFKGCLASDVKGMLSLYEASFLSLEGENLLDSAKDFSTHHLRERLEGITDPIVAEQVRHALELPLHWRVQKLEAKWFITVYESKLGANLILLELAKLDFNMVQALYQHEIKQLSRWYEETGLVEKLGFARHRLAECFLWAVGVTAEPQFGFTREIITKMSVLITFIDDIYDVYGTLSELQAFTHAIERWDINELDNLPEYMRICFLALFNSANELAYHILRDQGLNIIPNLKKLWAELSRAYYVEATWFHNGYFPSTNEYMNTAWVSIGGPIASLHAYFAISNPIDEKELSILEQYQGIIRWPSMVLRLADDLGTASDEMKKGDVPKSIQCHMHGTGCSEEDAREHIKHLIDVNLKRMNKDILMEKSVKSFGATAINIARIGLCIYQFGDGFGVPHNETKVNLVSLVVKPIPMQ
ncbi:1-8-cineole synthase 1- chloroplastic [Striga hermonthica]|uniref:1-8-cineole synthase 1- chloroplastic n=1 Tax=Striga hermonthica TaxID=68872 RepID=A0A9N7NS82_STRHE|nr:1-8-cineole synthase 1- chloroplastic [Striga hermonthica]